MDVGLDREQRAFAREAGKLAHDLSSRWDRGRGPDDVASSNPPESDWQRIVEAGWLAVRADEKAGGAGGSVVDVCVLIEQLGRHVVAAPVLGAVIALEQLSLRGADPAFIEQVVSGRTRLTTVMTADLTDFASAQAGTCFAFDSSGVDNAVVLDDQALVVKLAPFSTGADVTRGLSRIDGFDVTHRLDLEPASPETDGKSLAFALTLIAADLLGVMHGALDAAVEHAKVRTQFGVPIGSFQAVQHLAAEALVSVEATRSAVWYSAWAADELDAFEALEAARTAKAFASESAIQVVETAIQIFGGIGMTWESPAHIWQRRVHLDRRLLGDENTQYAYLAKTAAPHHREG